MAKRMTIGLKPLLVSILFSCLAGFAQQSERVIPITIPSTSLPPENESRDITQFSFIVYGDTRTDKDHDRTSRQHEHSLIVDSMVDKIKQLKNTNYPVRFVLQSGDAVFDGTDPHQWNVSFVPLINRITTEAGVPYFLVPGNHENTDNQQGLKNYLDATSKLIQHEASLHIFSGQTTYSFAYGNTFVVALDSTLANNEKRKKQLDWVEVQLKQLDKSRYVNIIVFCHQAPFSSGPHGSKKGVDTEAATLELRNGYMPLFNRNHVRVVFSGHEHFFEHWVEHYTDPKRTTLRRMDLVISGGGGAPPYRYFGDPETQVYLNANVSNHIKLERLFKPNQDEKQNPPHYVLVRVDGESMTMRIITTSGKAPYEGNEISLGDR